MFTFLSPLEQFSSFLMQVILIGPFDLSITNQAGILLLLFVVLLAIFVGLVRYCKFENILLFNRIPGKVMVKLTKSFKIFLASFDYLYKEEVLSILLFFYFQFFYVRDVFIIWYYFYQLVKIHSIMKTYGDNAFIWEAYSYIFQSCYANVKSKKLLLKVEHISQMEMETLAYKELSRLNVYFLEKVAYLLYIWKLILVSIFKFSLFIFLIILFM